MDNIEKINEELVDIPDDPKSSFIRCGSTISKNSALHLFDDDKDG